MNQGVGAVNITCYETIICWWWYKISIGTLRGRNVPTMSILTYYVTCDWLLYSLWDLVLFKLLYHSNRNMTRIYKYSWCVCGIYSIIGSNKLYQNMMMMNHHSTLYNDTNHKYCKKTDSRNLKISVLGSLSCGHEVTGCKIWDPSVRLKTYLRAFSDQERAAPLRHTQYNFHIKNTE